MAITKKQATQIALETFSRIAASNNPELALSASYALLSYGSPPPTYPFNAAPVPFGMDSYGTPVADDDTPADDES